MTQGPRNTERDKEIILMRLDKCTWREIGERFDISRERARQIVSHHRRRLKNGPLRLSMRAHWAVCVLLSDHTVLELLRLDGVGMTTVREVIDFMHRRGFWSQYDENGRYID